MVKFLNKHSYYLIKKNKKNFKLTLTFFWSPKIKNIERGGREGYVGRDYKNVGNNHRRGGGKGNDMREGDLY